MAAGALISNFLLPGVGPILAVGLSSGAFGIGGVVAGGAVGKFLENNLTQGLPKDEIFFYEDALRQGRSVLVGFAEDDDQIERGRVLMERAGAETLDAARKKWWIGLRDAEAAEYDANGKSFGDVEQIYRCGFEAALRPDCRGKSLEAVRVLMRVSYSDICDEDAFRRGYERGQLHHAEMRSREFREDSQ